MKLIKLEKYRCPACDKLSNKLNGEGVEFTAYNIEDNPEIASKYGVMSAPVLILEDNDGNEVTRVNGFFVDQVDQTIQRFEEGEA